MMCVGALESAEALRNCKEGRQPAGAGFLPSSRSSRFPCQRRRRTTALKRRFAWCNAIRLTLPSVKITLERSGILRLSLYKANLSLSASRAQGKRKGFQKGEENRRLSSPFCVSPYAHGDVPYCIGKRTASGVSALPFLHALPAVEAVDVVEKKHYKAKYHGKIRKTLQSGEHPQNYQHNIVGGIRERVVWATAECECRSNKACGDGQRGNDKTCVAECAKYKIEEKRDECGEHGYTGDARHGQLAYLYFSCPLIRMLEPFDYCYKCGGRAHAQIGYHLAVICQKIGYDPVKYGEYYGQNLTENVSLGNKYKRSYANKRCYCGKHALAARKHVR